MPLLGPLSSPLPIQASPAPRTKRSLAYVVAAQEKPERYEGWFDAIGELVWEARQLIEGGKNEQLGPLFDRNHMLLQQIGVSTPQLDQLVAAARGAGALGAKLSGGGGGGNIIALVETASAPNVTAALQSAGAVRVVITTIGV